MRRAAGYFSGGATAPAFPGSSIYCSQDYPKPRPQIFRYQNGIPIVSDKSISGPRGASPKTKDATEGRRLGCQESTPSKLTPGASNASTIENRPSEIPDWIAYDRQVLRFYAYFIDDVGENGLEQWRVRKCILYYYLEDGTLMISEPKEDNSGLRQGTFLRKHRVRLRDKPSEYISWRDVTVGQPLAIYGRQFHITGCDAYTRGFMLSKGVSVAEDKKLPEGPYQKEVQRQTKPECSKTAPCTSELLEARPRDQFMKYNRKVLRFSAYWDDTKSAFGDKLSFILQYYLVDDTVEIFEAKCVNSGRDSFPVFLRRMKLPKSSYGVGGRPLSADSRTRTSLSFYNWRDFRIGDTIKIYGRGMVLAEADDFTRRWYKDQLGMEDFELDPVKAG
ncbi:unnamed protein product [Ostreobium quekettii]|uniref:DM10 domain-containing protein n=1 Tax=Ostreobium quekettii TaxID=121088 RepID=A0A8S1JBI1_9CHLO|nr:unnamed protein product [Ostreobium quekettii]|eukprot:evm.model.scf_534.2 EVM.evm.TU.scf_534.2   scf_534:10617-17215(-)